MRTGRLWESLLCSRSRNLGTDETASSAIQTRVARFETSITDWDRYTIATFGKGVHMMSEYSFSSTCTEPYRYTLPSSRSPSRTLQVVVIGWCIMYHVMTMYVFGQIPFLAAYSGALVPGREDPLTLGNITLLAVPEHGHRRNRFISDSNSHR